MAGKSFDADQFPSDHQVRQLGDVRGDAVQLVWRMRAPKRANAIADPGRVVGNRRRIPGNADRECFSLAQLLYKVVSRGDILLGVTLEFFAKLCSTRRGG